MNRCYGTNMTDAMYRTTTRELAGDVYAALKTLQATVCPPLAHEQIRSMMDIIRRKRDLTALIERAAKLRMVYTGVADAESSVRPEDIPGVVLSDAVARNLRRHIEEWKATVLEFIEDCQTL